MKKKDENKDWMILLEARCSFLSMILMWMKNT